MAFGAVGGEDANMEMNSEPVPVDLSEFEPLSGEFVTEEDQEEAEFVHEITPLAEASGRSTERSRLGRVVLPYLFFFSAFFFTAFFLDAGFAAEALPGRSGSFPFKASRRAFTASSSAFLSP